MITGAPEQETLIEGIAFIVIAEPTFTEITLVEVQDPIVPVTVYVVLPIGETAITDVVALVFQEYVAAPLAVNVEEPPAQIAVDVALTFRLGVLFVIVIVFVLLQLPLFPVTVYVVVTVGETEMVFVVALVFQE